MKQWGGGSEVAFVTRPKGGCAWYLLGLLGLPMELCLSPGSMSPPGRKSSKHRCRNA